MATRTRAAALTKTGIRIGRALLQAANVTLRSVARAAHLLWLEVTGFFFLVFAAIGGWATYREYGQFAAGKIGAARVLVAFVFTAVFGYFGLSSFRRARQKN